MPWPNRPSRLAALHTAGRVLRSRHPSSSPPARVLLIRPDHIGDVLLSAPAVATLRAGLPDAELTYLVGPWSAAAAAGSVPRDVDIRTLAYPGFTRARNASLAQPYALLAQASRWVRGEKFDLAVVLRPDHWWGALLALAAGIPVRVGAATPETAPLLTHARVRLTGEHWAAEALEIARLALRAVGAVVPAVPERPSFLVSDAARLKAATVVPRGAIVIHPNAGALLKSWPGGRWAALANALDGPIVLSGAPGDEAVLDTIAQRMTAKPIVACGQSLEVSAAIFERCAVVVGPDSGALHLAAAVGTPTVRLYGPASADVFGPWPGEPAQRVLRTPHLVCAPCGFLVDPPCGARLEPACLLALGVDDVVQAIQGIRRATAN